MFISKMFESVFSFNVKDSNIYVHVYIILDLNIT